MLKRRKAEVGDAPQASAPGPTVVPTSNNVNVSVAAGKVTIPQASGSAKEIASGSMKESEFDAALGNMSNEDKKKVIAAVRTANPSFFKS